MEFERTLKPKILYGYHMVITLDWGLGGSGQRGDGDICNRVNNKNKVKMCSFNLSHISYKHPNIHSSTIYNSEVLEAS